MSSSPKELLAQQEAIFNRQTSLQCKWSAEIEFYLEASNDVEINIDKLSQQLGLAIEEEKGPSQYEIKLPIYSTAVELAEKIIHYKEKIRTLSQKQHINVSYEALPKDEQPGSGLHINLSIEDKNGHNLFMRNAKDETQITQNAVAGLLETMEYMMPAFAPTTESCKRYIAKTEAPTCIAWGANNRTVALRIPASSNNEESRHIEHRVPGIDAEPAQVLLAIYRGLHYGITYQLQPSHPKIYGNAYDPQYQQAPYNIKPLPAIQMGQS